MAMKSNYKKAFKKKPYMKVGPSAHAKIQSSMGPVMMSDKNMAKKMKMGKMGM